MQTARQLFISGAALPGEKLEAMLDRLLTSGAALYDMRGRRLDFVSLAACTNLAECKVVANSVAALTARTLVYAGPSRIKAEDIKHVCTVCEKTGGVSLAGAAGINIIICIECGSSDYSEELRGTRAEQNLLEDYQTSKVSLSFVR